MLPLYHRFSEFVTPPHSDDVFVYTIVGTRIRRIFSRLLDAPDCTLDALDEGALEWTDLLETVASAHGHFTMIELGAGYGRWTVAGGVVARKRGLRTKLVALEAEHGHFAMMRQHFIDNDLDPEAHTLIHAAVTPDGKPAYFTQGHSREWWGQSVLPSADYGFGNWPQAIVERAEGISLSAILAPLEKVDFVDLDIQGAEFDVLASAKDDLRKVKRVHIGTHGPEIEKNLIQLFSGLGWNARNCYGCGTTADTEYGRITFGDGVQSWINPAR